MRLLLLVVMVAVASAANDPVTVDYQSGNGAQIILKDNEGTGNGVLYMDTHMDNDGFVIRNKQGQADMIFATENGGNFRFCQDVSTDTYCANPVMRMYHANVGTSVSITDPLIDLGTAAMDTTTLRVSGKDEAALKFAVDAGTLTTASIYQAASDGGHLTVNVPYGNLYSNAAIVSSAPNVARFTMTPGSTPMTDYSEVSSTLSTINVFDTADADRELAAAYNLEEDFNPSDLFALELVDTSGTVHTLSSSSRNEAPMSMNDEDLVSNRRVSVMQTCEACDSGEGYDSSTELCRLPTGGETVDCDAGCCILSSSGCGYPCSTGTYGSDCSCTDASAGSYATGGTTQTACAAGTYTSTTGQSSCTACPAGHEVFASGTGNTDCDKFTLGYRIRNTMAHTVYAEVTMVVDVVHAASLSSVFGFCARKVGGSCIPTQVDASLTKSGAVSTTNVIKLLTSESIELVFQDSLDAELGITAEVTVKALV